MSGLEVNKILASIIMAVLIVTLIGHIGDLLINTEHHDEGETAYKIEVEAYAEGRNSEPRLACIERVVMVSVKKDNDGKYHKMPHGKSL